MATVIMQKFKDSLAAGTVNFNTTNYYIALVSDSINYVSNLNLVNNWSSVSSNEVVGTNYTAGGKLLTGVGWYRDDVSNRVRISASPVSWDNSTITAKGAVIRVSGTNDNVMFYDFGSNQTTSNASFVLSFSSTGLAYLS